jgi:hypothetical protein
MEALFERAEEVELCSSANGRSHSSAVPSVMMVGHLDELSLSGISSASSFTSVTGFSLLVTTSFP